MRSRLTSSASSSCAPDSSPTVSHPQPTAATQFILASGSPRRIAFLREAGYGFESWPAEVPEIPTPGEAASAYALRLALAKAQAAQARWPGLPSLGADTDVVLEGRILGKPRDADDAVEMLMALSGCRHQVISAVALVAGRRAETALSVTDIDFAELSLAQARAYAASGEPLDKAGAYAIQGGAARFVRALRGSYTGVVGLPLTETCELLARFGLLPPGEGR